jgi:hypothetical protein
MSLPNKIEQLKRAAKLRKYDGSAFLAQMCIFITSSESLHKWPWPRGQKPLLFGAYPMHFRVWRSLCCAAKLFLRRTPSSSEACGK